MEEGDLWNILAWALISSDVFDVDERVWESVKGFSLDKPKKVDSCVTFHFRALLIRHRGVLRQTYSFNAAAARKFEEFRAAQGEFVWFMGILGRKKEERRNSVE
jgi:hypothetical protein